MQSTLALIRRHPLVTFFILAYAVSWGPALVFSGTLNPFGPLLAALIVVLLAGGRAGLKEWWHRITRWRGNPAWYVAALLIPFAVNFGAAALNMLFGAPAPTGDMVARWPELFIVFPLYFVAFGPLGEETGWRGFAMPRLLGGHSPLTASLILGVFIALWHLPLVLGGTQPSIMLLGVAAAQIMYTWLAMHVEGKVLIVMVAHAAQGAFGGEYFGSMFSGSWDTQQTWLLVAVQCAVALVIIALTSARLGRRSPSPVLMPAAH
jgi:membrane protease YdiL (CAAX protease family)